jgi:hypothetical protein
VVARSVFSLIGPVSPVRAPFSVAACGEKRVALGVRVDIRPLNTRGEVERMFEPISG